jgi:Tfp pilus assembly protein PilE
MKPGVRPDGGYTLLEVMIFLAISSLLLFVTNVVFSGQAARTEFVGSMNNVNSKMQDWINGVSNGLTGNTSAGSAHSGNYVCTIDPATNAPKLTSPQSADDSVRGNAIGSNLPCVFLGKAILANDNTSDKTSLWAYTVIGKRTYANGAGTILVDNLKNAAPTAGVFNTDTSDEPEISLVEEYKIPNGAQIRHAWSSDNTNPSPHDTLGAFFIDPSNASNALLAVQYPLSASYDPTNWSGAGSAWDIIKCINLDLPSQQCKITGSTPDNLWPMSTWNICFESTRDDERALLQVISTDGHGATTKLKLGKGDEACS